MASVAMSKQALMRMPLYLNYLKSIRGRSCPVNISATTIADKLGLNQVQVRKDLSAISNGGKPKIGYVVDDLIFDIEEAMGYHKADTALLVGAGNLGKALLNYKGFADFGLEILLAFDRSPAVVGSEINGVRVLEMERLEEMCSRLGIRMGIITVPEDAAQLVASRMVAGGIRAIWNFTTAHLTVPSSVLVQNENMALSLAALSRHLADELTHHEPQ